MSNYWKKKLDELNQSNANSSSGSAAPADYWKQRMTELEKEEQKKKEAQKTTAPITRPHGGGGGKVEPKRTWFQKGLFEDGYDFGDVTRTILGTDRDVKENAATGVIGIGEKIVDALLMIGASQAQGEMAKRASEEIAFNAIRGKNTEGIRESWDKTAKDVKDQTSAIVAKDLYDEEKVAKAIVTGPLDKYIDTKTDSVLGEKSDALAQSAGQLAVQYGANAIAPGSGMVLVGLTSLGSEAESALQQGATFEEATLSGAISAGAEMLTEKIGGINFGGKTLTDAAFEKLSRHMTSKISKFLITSGKLSVDALSEGGEEIMSGYIGAVGQKLTYMEEKEIKEIFTNEELFESFIGGVVLGGGGGTVSAVKATAQGTDYVSGLNKNEKSVVDKVYQDRVVEAEKNGKVTERQKTKIYDEVIAEMEKGYISTDTIEEVLGDRSSYDSLAKEAEEYDTLYNTASGQLSKAQQDRLAELDAKNKANPYKDALKNTRDQHSQSVFELTKDTRLSESYNEKVRRSQAYQADLSVYDTKQQAVIQKAIDSGILNNTRRAHEFVDMVAKISADKGVLFDFTDNARLKESGFAVDGKFVNGYVTKDGVTVNIDSAKSLNSIVGHEITHVLEGTEVYDALKQTVFEYAKIKGDYQGRYDSLTELYKNIKDADVEAELAADLVGDYLFTDADFINNLSTQNRNVFQKIYDEIKYLYKVATAGSKEARELEKVKKAFEKAYREGSKGTTDTKYSLIDNLSPLQAQVLNTMVANIKREAERNNISLRQFYDETAEINAFSPTKADVNKIADSLVPIVEQLDIENFYAYLDKMRSYAAETDTNTKYSMSDSDGKQLSNEKINRVTEDGLTMTYVRVPNQNTQNYGSTYGQNIEPAGEYMNMDTMQGKHKIDGYEYGTIQFKKPLVLEHINTSDTGWKKTVSDMYNGLTGKELTEALINDGYDAIVTYDDYGYNEIVNLNGKKLSDHGVRFSLSEAVEETKELMALHNLTEAKLLKSLKLGGLPMPSVAIAKAKDGHGEFGEISLILTKDAIDPQVSSRNKLYSGDAWTPTYPKVDFKPDEKVLRKVRDKINTLVPYEVQNVLGNPMFDTDNATDSLNRYNGNMVDAYNRDDAMKYAYLKDTGSDISLPMKEEDLVRYGEVSNSAVRYFSGKLVNGLQTVEHYQNMSARDMLEDKALTEAVADALNWDVLRTLEPGSPEYTEYERNPAFVADEVTFRDIDRLLSGCRKLFTNGIQQTVDRKAAKELIRDTVDQAAYESWLENLFSGVIEKEGIRNNKDYLTPSGNRRSFEALHYEHNLENVIKAMRETGEKGIGNGFGGASIFGASTTEFSSIEDMKRSSDRLQMMSYEEYQEMRKQFTDRFLDIAIRLPNTKNSFSATDSAAEVLTEAVAKYKTRSGIANYLRRELKGWATYSDQVVVDLIDLVNDIRKMPTGYFEAKPQRAVGFDEVGVFVIPRNADIKLKQELLNRGYSIAEYDPDVEGDRQKVVNQFEEYKFSLSNVGEVQKQYGNYNISGKGIRLDKGIAPVKENLTTNATRNASELSTSQEKSQLSEEKSTVAPVAEVTDMFPDTPVQDIEELMAEAKDIMGAMEAYEAVGDTASVEQLMPEYEAVMEKIGQIEEEDRQRVDSLTEGDIPPEMDAPYSDGQPAHVEDPFEDRDWHKVGNQKVKAYMYENPEVKPFFQSEALNLLGELNSTTRGERWYNDEVYYESGGEKGFGGVKRHTSASMEELLDSWGMSYADIEKGLNAIIEDHGAENIAAAKKLEFMLNDRLLNGYKDFYTNGHVPPNQDYINLLTEKQITEYSKEAFDAFMANADQYAPPVDDDIAPVQNAAPTETVNTDSMKGVNKGQLTYITTEDKLKNRYPQPGVADGNIAPSSEVKTEQKNVQEGQQAMWEGAEGEPKRQTRKELHGSIIDNIKSRFSAKGFDLDNVLKGAKNLSTFATVDNTPQRVMEKALGYKEGQILSDITVNQVAQNETEATKWLNSFTHRKSGILAQLSKKYNIKPGSKQSAAAQMYAEGFYVNENNEIIKYGDAELAKDFPDVNVQANIKGLARDPRIRQIYDDTLAMINESRTRNAYPEIPRLDNYFLHFRAMDDTFSRLGLPFNPNDIRAKDLPTDLNGVTADLKPGQPYFASAMHRKGMRTSFDLLGGLERYLTSAKNQIYHIDDIQTLRALRNYIADTYGQANGLEGLDALSEEEAQERIEKVYSSHLSTFAKFLNEEANVLAGKTALIDRGLEGILGRRGMTFLDTVNKQVGSNMVGFNISSSLTNFLPVAQTFAKTNKADFVKAFGQTVGNKIGSVFGKTDGFTENSPVVIRRKGADRFYRTPFQKVGDAGYVFMSAVDDISTELIARTKYNELIRKGMDSQQAHYETDKWVSRLMGDRSLGQMPQLYNSKMLGLITKFQLEVRNQLDSQFYDTIQEAKVSNEHIQNGLARNAKTAAKVTSTFVQLAVAQHLFGKAFESVAGYNPAFDIIEVIMTAFGFDDEEESEDTVLDNVEQGFLAMLEDLPYTSTFTGGRIPISSALPIKELVTGKDDYGTDKSRLETLGEVAPYYVLPGGYGQIKKTVQGVKMFSDEHPVTGSYTDKGDLRFPVDDTLVNRVQAGVFGQYASKNARKYFDNNLAPLNEKQVQEYATLGLSYDEYWAYRDDMSAISKRADVEGASDEDVVKSKYINSISSELSDIQKEKERILNDANMTAEEKEEKVGELEKQFADLVKERYNSYNHVSLDGDYAKIGSYYYQWYTPEDGDPYWRKLTDSQVTKYTLTKNAGNAHYVTNGSVHYRRNEDGEWVKISDKQLARQKEVTNALGITPDEYWSKTDISFLPMPEGEYEYAFDHPDNYAVAKAVGGYDAYKGYSKELYDIKADKDKNGKSISGSRKEKVLDYINNLDADYGEKIILFKSEYPSDDTYNYEIIEYLNSRDDISYSEMETILKELGFNVSSDGNITWD